MQVVCAPVQIKYRTSTSKQNIYYKHLLEKTQTHTHTQARAHNNTHMHTQAGVWHNRLHISAKGQQSPQILLLPFRRISAVVFSGGKLVEDKSPGTLSSASESSSVGGNEQRHSCRRRWPNIYSNGSPVFLCSFPASFPAPPSLPSPPITPNPVEYCWRESVEFKVTVGGSGKGDGGLWPARLLGTHPLPIILLYCTPPGPLPACRPEEAFLRASSSRKSDNLSALLKTQPQTKTGGDRERPQSYQLCRDEGGWMPGEVPIEIRVGS